MNNTGTTLALDTANNGIGTWNLASGGSIIGGTVTTANGAQFIVSSLPAFGTGATLSGLTIAANSTLGRVRQLGSLSINPGRTASMA